MRVHGAMFGAAVAWLHNERAQRKRVTSRPRHAHLLARAPPPHQTNPLLPIPAQCRLAFSHIDTTLLYTDINIVNIA
ncbi:unnamed protein product [Arctia plantaginis]|uniref:Uncharacterized protein n=1 Tax=Arctia plantaginis TaxID=874455 RepID=A0A8S1B5H8_ARCPL|nr:unnamed protein product [Arctia plantaginis]